MLFPVNNIIMIHLYFFHHTHAHIVTHEEPIAAVYTHTYSGDTCALSRYTYSLTQPVIARQILLETGLVFHRRAVHALWISDCVGTQGPA